MHVSRETTPAGARRDDAVREALGGEVEWVETGTPYAVGPGLVDERLRRPVQGLHAVREGVARRTGGQSPAPTPRELPLRHARNDADATAALDAALSAPDLPDLPDRGRGGGRCAGGGRSGTTHLTATSTTATAPALDATSRMSPYLKLGVVHPRTLLADLADRSGAGVETFRRRAGVARVLRGRAVAQPAQRVARPAAGAVGDARTTTRRTPSRRGSAGRTGYPVVDAGMRQLLAEGWMHNRVRMITASFLTKDLHVWWPVGARHFLDHLVDGDVASNNHGWQWVAGTGTDASPYFRVFNPVTQGEKFDPDGEYVRRWVPELRAPAPARPRTSRGSTTTATRTTTRERIVDHAEERREALDRLAATKS